MRKYLPWRLILAQTLYLCCAISFAYEINGKVIKVTDGDTITIMEDNYNKQRIRLADIDAPEKGQPYGKKSKQYLASLVAGNQVKAVCREKDKYGRDVCTVFVNNIDVNADLVASGHVWVYERYNERSDLPILQETAKQDLKGLWQLPEAQIVKPSDWRHGQKEVQAQIKAAKKQQIEYVDSICGSKRYCKQMKDCSEAQYHLLQCGIKSLDGERDDISCESICTGG